MRRKLVVRAIPAALVATMLAVPAESQPAVPDGLRAFAIIHPGQDGSLTSFDVP
jgi:hypothetical protein